MNDLNFDLGKALSILLPGARWRLTGNSFDGLEWLDEREQPSEESLREVIDRANSDDAARKIWPSSGAFWAEFTDSEKLNILSSTIPGIILLREELRLWIGEVWSDDGKVQAGLNGLVAVKILTIERKVVILSHQR